MNHLNSPNKGETLRNTSSSGVLKWPLASLGKISNLPPTTNKSIQFPLAISHSNQINPKEETQLSSSKGLPQHLQTT